MASYASTVKTEIARHIVDRHAFGPVEKLEASPLSHELVPEWHQLK
jgi:hypothetical protein